MVEVAGEMVGQKAEGQLASVEYRVVDALIVRAPSADQGKPEGLSMPQWPSQASLEGYHRYRIQSVERWSPQPRIIQFFFETILQAIHVYKQDL
jgi:hypothetical protein